MIPIKLSILPSTVCNFFQELYIYMHMHTCTQQISYAVYMVMPYPVGLIIEYPCVMQVCCVCVYVCVCVCMCVCVCLCVCIYVCVYMR